MFPCSGSSRECAHDDEQRTDIRGVAVWVRNAQTAGGDGFPVARVRVHASAAVDAATAASGAAVAVDGATLPRRQRQSLVRALRSDVLVGGGVTRAQAEAQRRHVLLS